MELKIQAMKIAAGVVCFFALVASFASCSQSGGGAVDALVAELNSEQFRAAEVRTGLFSDSKAEVRGDTLSLTFFCVPGINLSGFDRNGIPELRSVTVSEFKSNLADRRFREGIEALADNGMVLVLVWRDVHGTTIELPVSPAEVLGRIR